MRQINKIVVHCSATKEGQNISRDTIRQWHLDRGWRDIGYHFVIELDGSIHPGRPLEEQGAHVRGHNADSIGICYVGGLDSSGAPKDTRTDIQKDSLDILISGLKKQFPGSFVCGHRDLSPDRDGDGKVERHEWLKACPCFDALNEFKGC